MQLSPEAESPQTMMGIVDNGMQSLDKEGLRWELQLQTSRQVLMDGDSIHLDLVVHYGTLWESAVINTQLVFSCSVGTNHMNYLTVHSILFFIRPANCGFFRIPASWENLPFIVNEG